jgi:hypothetical protein
MDELSRMWEQLMGRWTGPMSFRFFLQPLVASILGIRSGLRDAREGKAAFFWSALTNPEARPDLLRHGWKDVGKVFLLAVILDLVYQVIALPGLYPLQKLIVAVVLAFVPYVVVRGLTNRIAGAYRRGKRETAPK